MAEKTGKLNNPKAGENLTNKGKGRPKGSKNLFTEVKEGFAEVFMKKGGVEGLLKWANQPENEEKFYNHCTKLFPKEIAVDLDATIEGGVLVLPKQEREKKK